MSQSSSADASAATVFRDNVWFQGILLTCIAYGSTITLCFQCLSLLLPRLRWTKFKSDYPIILFVSAMFVLSSSFQGAAMKIAQDTFVNNTNLSKGSEAYEQTYFSLRINALANATLITSCFLSDALLVCSLSSRLFSLAKISSLLWRCVVVYQSTSVPEWGGALFALALWLTEFSEF